MSQGTKRLVVLIPARNEEATLEAVIRGVYESLRIIRNEIEPTHRLRASIVVANDGSTDATVAIAQRLRCRVVSHASGRGVGAITKTGLLFAAKLKPDYLLKIDGDGQYFARLMPLMVAALMEGSDIVNCSRFHADVPVTSEVPGHKWILNLFAREALRDLTGWDITDARSGLLGFRGDLISDIAPRIKIKTYGIPMELLVRCWNRERQLRFTELPHWPQYFGMHVSDNRRLRVAGEKRSLSAQMRRFMMVVRNYMMVLEDEGLWDYHCDPERIGNQWFSLHGLQSRPMQNDPIAQAKGRVASLALDSSPVEESEFPLHPDLAWYERVFGASGRELVASATQMATTVMFPWYRWWKRKDTPKPSE